MSRMKPEHVTHDDLWSEIGNTRNLALKIALLLVTAGLAGFAWVAQVENSHASDVGTAVGSMQAQVKANAEQVQAAMDSQRRIEQRLDEIMRMLREDAREQRDAMQDHVRTQHGSSMGK